MSKPKSKLIFGDPHGCYSEVEEILERVSYSPLKFDVYCTGDLVNRGPDALKTFRLFRKLNAKVVLGNHELEHINIRKGLWEKTPRSERTKNQFGNFYDEFLDYAASLPLFIEEDDFILVHAGVYDGKHPSECDIETLVNIRFQKNSITGESVPWFENYTSKKLIIFGHWAKLDGLISDNAIGLDRGCVYGRKMRALIMPEKEIVEVDAFKQYYDPLNKIPGT